MAIGGRGLVDRVLQSELADNCRRSGFSDRRISYLAVNKSVMYQAAAGFSQEVTCFGGLDFAAFYGLV